MTKLVLLKGLPGSGKSTWARERVLSDPSQWKRVNKDEIRKLIHAGKWSGKLESAVEAVEYEIAGKFLAEDVNVIVDDTNFHPKHPQRFKELAKEFGAEFETKTFDTPIEECIANDLKRPDPVGEAVIRRMYYQHVYKPEPAPKHDPKLPTVIICDLDGTLALLNGRNPYDPDTVLDDQPNTAVVDLVTTMGEGRCDVVFFSGRKEKYRDETVQWLGKINLENWPLHMRADDDNRKDSILKRELYDTHVKGKANVLFVLDDRQQVVDEWRLLGLTCLQVARGDF